MTRSRPGAHRAPVGLAIMALLLSSCGGEVVEQETTTSAYNVQFLAPDFFIEFGAAWPNTQERAELIGQELGCPDVALLSETVSDDARASLKQGLASNNCRTFGNDRWEFVTLQHDFGILEDILNGPEIASVVSAYAAGEILDLKPEEAAALGFVCSAGAPAAGAIGLPPEVVAGACTSIALGAGEGDVLPVIDEEVAIATRWPIVSVDQLEFSQGSGIDRLAAKGALIVHIHVPTINESTVDPRTEATGTSEGNCGPLGCTDVPGIAIPPSEPKRWSDGGYTVAYVVTHFDTTRDVRGSQIAELAEFIDDHVLSTTPLVIGGDFNIRPVAQGVYAQGSIENFSLQGEFVELLEALREVRPDLSAVVVPATNKQGWNFPSGPACSKTEIEGGECTGGAVDHIFFSDDFAEVAVPSLVRDYHPVGPDNAVVLTQLRDEAVNETLSDHAEIRSTATVRVPLYSDLAATTTVRRITVRLGTLFLDDSEGLCREVDPQIWAELWVGDEKVDGLMAGPADDNRRLSIDEALTGTLAAGETVAELRITEVSDDDSFLCESDTPYDITATNSFGTARFYIDTSTRFGIWEVDDDERYTPFGPIGQWISTTDGTNSLNFRVSVRATS